MAGKKPKLLEGHRWPGKAPTGREKPQLAGKNLDRAAAPGPRDLRTPTMNDFRTLKRYYLEWYGLCN